MVQKSPKTTLGWQSREDAPIDSDEVPLCKDMICENNLYEGRRLVIQTSVYAKAKEGKRLELREIVDDHENELNTRIRRIVSNATYDQVIDPKLKVIRELITDDVKETLQTDCVETVLIPEWNSEFP